VETKEASESEIERGESPYARIKIRREQAIAPFFFARIRECRIMCNCAGGFFFCRIMYIFGRCITSTVH
jgi:hypothetical protein